jgi:Uma2 family endonuclease
LTAKITAADLELLPDELHCELWDGRLVRLPPEPTIHQLAMRSVATALDDQCPGEALVVHSLPIGLDRHNVLRPDVVVLRAEGAWRDTVRADGVLLVAEVCSPWSEAADRGAKVARYASTGIANYWMVDVLADRASIDVLRRGPAGRYREHLSTTELVTLEEPWKVTLDLPAWTRKRDRLRAAASADV